MSYEKSEMKVEMMKEPQKHELKQFSTHLLYAFLDDEKSYPIIINASLSKIEAENLW